MKLCQVYCGVFGAWGWEDMREDGTVEESRDVFETLYECVEDARRHGYKVRRAPQIPLQSTPVVSTRRRVEEKTAIAA